MELLKKIKYLFLNIFVFEKKKIVIKDNEKNNYKNNNNYINNSKTIINICFHLKAYIF